MAVSTIGKNSFGNWGSASSSFPFTAPTDGFVYAMFNPSTGDGYQYVVLNVGPVAVKLLTAGGGLTHGIFPVKAGETVSIGSNTGGAVTHRFRSIW